MSSWESLAWAKKQQVGNPMRKLIFLLLAEKTDEEFSCFPGRKKLAAEAETSERSVVTHERALEAAGLITIVEQYRPNWSRTSGRIYINHPDAPHVRGVTEVCPRPGLLSAEEVASQKAGLTVRQEVRGGAGAARGGCRSCTGGVQEVHPPGVQEVHPSEPPREHPTPTTHAGKRGTARSRTETVPEEGEELSTFWAQMPGNYRPSLTARAGVREELARLLATRSPEGLAAEVLAQKPTHKAVRHPVPWVLKVVTRLPDEPSMAEEPAGTITALAPVCGHCDAREGDPISCRTRDDNNGKPVKCPECHPHAAQNAA